MKILFLGEKDNVLFKELQKRKEDIHQINKKIKLSDVNFYDLIISFGYRYIVKKNIIDFF